MHFLSAIHVRVQSLHKLHLETTEGKQILSEVLYSRQLIILQSSAMIQKDENRNKTKRKIRKSENTQLFYKFHV